MAGLLQRSALDERRTGNRNRGLCRDERCSGKRTTVRAGFPDAKEWLGDSPPGRNATALLLKPDMGHLETWPDLFESGVTIETHAWDLSDLEEMIEAVLANPESAVEIAAEGQRRYRRHIAEEGGGEVSSSPGRAG